MHGILTSTEAIQRHLDRLDRQSTRPLRAVLAAQAEERTPDPADLNRLAALEAEAARLRGLIGPRS